MDGKPDAPPFYKPDLSPAQYVGQAKGKKQILYERGMWLANMVERVDEDDPKGRDQSLSMDNVLGSCPDFRNETSALQTYVESRGHILVMSPKGHCELAGELKHQNNDLPLVLRSPCVLSMLQVMVLNMTGGA